MKTISGKPISTKPISLSKAAKILSKFVSAENGASHVISVYLNRASSSFNELKQLHKEINSPRSDRKHKRDRSETHDHREKIQESSIWSVEQNQGSEQSKNEFRKHQDAIEEHAEKDGGNEKHKKKKKKRDDELQVQGDNGVEEGEGERKPLTKAVNEDEENVVEEKHKKKKKPEDESKKHGVSDRVEIEEGSNKGKISKAQESLESQQEQDDAADDIKGMEEGKTHKKEKKKKEDKDSDGVKRAQKKRKNEDVEGEVEDRSGELKKKKKRKHGGDS